MKKVYMIGIIIVVSIMGAITYSYFKGKPVSIETNKKVDELPEEISEVIYYASMAPNSHNTQLWKVLVDTDNNKIKISLDNERTLKEVDSKDREAYISIGAFTENLLKAFEAYGYETNIQISDENENLVSVTYKKLNDSTIKNDTLNLIMKRHSDKREFLDKYISSENINKLSGEDSNVSYFEKDSELGEYLKETEISAMKQQAYDKNKAEEFSKWLRLSDKEALDSRDGLPAEQLGLTGIIKTIYYMTTTHESAVEDTYAKQSVDTTKKQVENCSGFLIITGGTSIKDLIETGRLLERTWLKAAELNISVQALSQILEEELYCTETNEKLKVDLPIQMILRVGYVKEYGENNRIRRDLSDYVTVK